MDQTSLNKNCIMNCINTDKTSCSSCSACINACSNNAITMIEDEYGFKYPHVDSSKCTKCGLCEKTCKNINNVETKLPIKTIAAQSKNVEILEKSSSGGMFSHLAKYILSQNGVVFGCAMSRIDEIFKAEHIYIKSETELYKLQGSKYIQSDIGNTYKQAKDFLEQGILVLYTGTPCQIAGLKAFLKKDYTNLYTVDVLCAGVPNQSIFNRYVKYIEQKRKTKLSELFFRNKKNFGWSCNGYIYKDNEGKEHKIFGQHSLYHTLFLSSFLIRESCFSCKYSSPKRISDITIGDAWGIEFAYPELVNSKTGLFNKNLGISILIASTEKGLELLSSITDNIIYKDIDFFKIQEYNGPLNGRENNRSKRNNLYLDFLKKNDFSELNSFYKKNVGIVRYYYRKLLPYIPKMIKENYRKLLNQTKKVDCMLMTWGNIRNYGSILTAYALYKQIKKLGYTAKLIKFYDTDKDYANDFIEKNEEFTSTCINYNDLKNLSKISNTFILGSDQQLNFNLLGSKIYKSLFFYITRKAKKVIISGSFGNDKLDICENSKKIISDLLERFDYVSMRENSGAEIMKNEFNCNSDWTIDPVFLLERTDYEKLIFDVKQDYSNSIMAYFTLPNDLKNNIVQKISKDYQLEIIDFPTNQISKKDIKNKNISVGNWLKAIMQSKLIITDSFHCLCFAILFNKTFICINNNLRFQSLFDMFNIKNANTFDENNIIINNNINYHLINNEIKVRTDFLRNKITDILSSPRIISNKQFIAEDKLKKIDNKILTKGYWYRENKLFYIFVIKLLIEPLRKIIERKS